MRRLAVLIFVAAGCTGDKPEDSGASATVSTPPPSACGEVTEGYEVRLQGAVSLQGEPVAGAEVTIREKLWNAGRIHGTATTDADGLFEVQVTEIVSVEECWGTALDYTADVTWETWARSRDLNSTLYAAIIGSGEADIRSSPIELDEDWRPPLDTGP